MRVSRVTVSAVVLALVSVLSLGSSAVGLPPPDPVGSQVAGGPVPSISSASATPPPPLVPNISVPGGPRDDGLTAGQKKVVKYSTTIYNKAVYHFHHRLDYVKAIKAVGGTAKKAKYRRQFAGGFWAAGGKITHISNSERLKVKKYKLTSATGTPPNPAVVVASGGGTNLHRGHQGRDLRQPRRRSWWPLPLVQGLV